jgi:hypothetical protein
MLALLLLAQVATTNCHSDSLGGVHCTTTTPPPLVQSYPQTQTVDQDWGAVFEARRERKRAEAIGKMLARGDCAGAQQYALSKGEIALAAQIRDYCSK